MTSLPPQAAPNAADALARRVAQVLLEVGAVAINVANPFTYSSGAKSPVYCDNRLLISYPDKRRTIIEAMAGVLRAEVGVDAIDVVGGVATAGIPWAAWVAEALDKPMVYVRDAPKGHGKGQRVEGVLGASQRAVIIEDLITTGKGCLSGVEGARETGATVAHAVSIFTYEWAQGVKALAAANVSLHPLSRISVLLQVALESGALSSSDLQAVQAWVAEHA